jgi:hypothetical protein
MTKLEIQKKIARLESINDLLSTRITEIDEMMRKIGFSNGLQTVKLTALEIIEKGLLK